MVVDVMLYGLCCVAFLFFIGLHWVISIFLTHRTFLSEIPFVFFHRIMNKE